MKLATESQEDEAVWLKPIEFELIGGLIGFEDVTQFELLVNEEEAPFMWIRACERHELGFVVVEPHHALADYDVEISDDDVAKLELESDEEALILNIVTLPNGESAEEATINLIGPILINKRTLKGKQVIIMNYQSWSARHPLIAQAEAS